MLKIQVIFGSTRDGRKGEKVAQWIYKLAKARKDWEVELVDLKEWNLPFFNDPKTPGSGEYSFDYTKRWSAKISEADGFVIVTPEYNHGYPASLKNALDLLYDEWNKKPVGFISYGGLAGGARAVEQLRQVVNELEMVAIQKAVHLARFSNLFDEKEEIKDDYYNKLAEDFLNQLVWWTNLLKKARNSE